MLTFTGFIYWWGLAILLQHSFEWQRQVCDWGKAYQRWGVELAGGSAPTLPSAAAAQWCQPSPARGMLVCFQAQQECLSSGWKGQWDCGTLLRKSQVNGWWKEVTTQPLKTGLPQHYLLCPFFLYPVSHPFLLYLFTN